MYRWEIWALWTALFTGLGVLGHTAWTWPGTAALPVATALPAKAEPAPAPRSAMAPMVQTVPTVPTASTGAATSVLLADEDNASRSMASAAAIILVGSQPASLPSDGAAFAAGTNRSARTQLWGATPEVTHLPLQAERRSASTPGPNEEKSLPVSSMEVDLPAFPIAVPVPEPYFW